MAKPRKRTATGSRAKAGAGARNPGSAARRRQPQAPAKRAARRARAAPPPLPRAEPEPAGDGAAPEAFAPVDGQAVAADPVATAPPAAWAAWDATAPPAPWPGPAEPRRSRYASGAIAALVVGVAGIWISPFGLLLGPVAIGLAVWARRQIRADPGLEGRGFATAGLVTGIASIVVSAAVALFLAGSLLWGGEGLFGVGAMEDEGEDVVAVQGGLLSRNADADAARELVVAVAAWDEDRDSPVAYEGSVHVVLEASADGGATWTALANRSVEVEPPDFDEWMVEAYVEFTDVELDRAATYRALVRVTVQETGEAFEDLVPPVAGEAMPEHFQAYG